MSDKTLKYIIASAIAMLLVYQIGALISGFFGMAWGVVSAVVVIAVSFFQCGCPGRAANVPRGFSCQPCCLRLSPSSIWFGQP